MTLVFVQLIQYTYNHHRKFKNILLVYFPNKLIDKGIDNMTHIKNYNYKSTKSSRDDIVLEKEIDCF